MTAKDPKAIRRPSEGSRAEPAGGRRRHGHQGFVLTLELLLLASLFLIVLVGGLALLRRGLTQLARDRMESSVLVVDAEGRFLGRAQGFDETEAPLVLLREPESHTALLLAVHPRRLASRQDVYFLEPECRGPAFLLAAGFGEGATSTLGALQRRAYGVGPGGALFLSSTKAIPGSPAVASRWVSRRADPGPLCEELPPEPRPGLLPAEVALDLETLYRAPFVVPIPDLGAESAAPSAPR